MAKLIAQSGPNAGREYPLIKDLTILGRQSSCDVQVVDNVASRAHAQVRRDGRFYTLVDLGSRNGTQLNGRKVGERQLTYGDRIRIGEVELLLVKEPGDLELRDLLTKYQINEKIGEGGMGLVFKAVQVSMARPIALKILAPKYASRPKFVDQFIREARAAGALNHQNIIQVHDVGTENDIHYFSMEFVDGPTCMQVIRDNGPFEVEEALEIVRQTARALEYAHSHRLIHQDIKPDNIMVGSDNVVKLADLGISKTFEEAAGEGQDQTRQIMGTPHYMAPEAALGKKLDHRIDLYSLGATLYHLLTGKTPFHGTNAADVLKAQVMEAPSPIKELNPRIPEPVVRLVERLLAKNPDDRYQTAAEVQDVIRGLLDHKDGSSDRISAGGDTLILRRYVAGKDSPLGGEVGHTTNSTSAKTGEAAPTRSQMRLVTWIVFAIIALLVVSVLVAAVSAAFKSVAAQSTQPAAVASGTPEPIIAVASPPVALEPTPEAKALITLADLDRMLGRPTDLIDVESAAALLASIPTEGLDQVLVTRRAKVAAQLDTIAQRRVIADREAAFAILDKEVQGFVAEANFDLAANRIDAFKHQDDQVLADRVKSRRAATDQAKADFVRDLETLTVRNTARKDLEALKAQREALPKAWLGTPQAQAIDAAISRLESAKAGSFDHVLAATTKQLAAWDLAAVERSHSTNRAAAEGTPAAERLDALKDTAIRLRALTKAVIERMKVLRQVRYPGILSGYDQPDLMDANENQGLELKEARGGTVYLDWKRLKVDELTQVCQTVLGAKEAEAFQSAITALGQAQEQAKK